MTTLKIQPAGEHPSLKYSVYEGPMPRSHTMTDAPDKSRPKRPCARCDAKFQPTVRRRLLCARCFRGTGGALVE